MVVGNVNSGDKKDHDWVVDQIADLFLTTHRVKTQDVIKRCGHHCRDIEISGYLVHPTGPVPLVLDLLLAHERWDSGADPTLNSNLHYPNVEDRSSNEATSNKIRKYRSDYNNRSPNAISCMSPIDGTSGRLHSEFVLLLFLQIIGKLTVFLQIQEFNLHNLTVDTSASTT